MEVQLDYDHRVSTHRGRLVSLRISSLAVYCSMWDGNVPRYGLFKMSARMHLKQV